MYILGFLLQVKASGAEGVRMEEAIKINTSLAAFGKGVPLTLPSASSLHSLCHGWVHAVVKAEGCGYVRLVLTDQPHAYSNDTNIQYLHMYVCRFYDDYQYVN